MSENKTSQVIFSMLLKTAGHDARTAHDGPTAVQVAFGHQVTGDMTKQLAVTIGYHRSRTPKEFCMGPQKVKPWWKSL